MAAVIALEKGGVGEVTMVDDGSAKGRPPFRFVFISGEGADHTQKHMMKFARVMVSASHRPMTLPLTLHG